MVELLLYFQYVYAILMMFKANKCNSVNDKDVVKVWL